MDSRIIFEYRHKPGTAAGVLGKTGTAVSVIAFLAVFIPAAVFTVFAFISDPMFLVLAAFLYILSFLFGPYAVIIRKKYYFALTGDNRLIMTSIINFIPRSYNIFLGSVSKIEWDNPAKSTSLLFRDAEGGIKGRFNPLMINPRVFQKYLNEISQRNSHITIAGINSAENK